MVTYAAVSLAEAFVSLRKSPTFTPVLLAANRRNARTRVGLAAEGKLRGEIFLRQQSRNVIENIDHPSGKSRDVDENTKVIPCLPRYL